MKSAIFSIIVGVATIVAATFTVLAFFKDAPSVDNQAFPEMPRQADSASPDAGDTVAAKELLNSAHYRENGIILGLKAADQDGNSIAATSLLITKLIENTDGSADEIEQDVLSSSVFSRLISGDTAPLVETGIAARMRAAILAEVSTTCSSSKELSTVVSCRVQMAGRALFPDGHSVRFDAAATGAGSNAVQATEQAVDRWVMQTPYSLD